MRIKNRELVSRLSEEEARQLSHAVRKIKDGFDRHNKWLELRRKYPETRVGTDFAHFSMERFAAAGMHIWSIGDISSDPDVKEAVSKALKEIGRIVKRIESASGMKSRRSTVTVRQNQEYL